MLLSYIISVEATGKAVPFKYVEKSKARETRVPEMHTNGKTREFNKLQQHTKETKAGDGKQKRMSSSTPD